MRVVGYVVKALAPGERAAEARCYALGNVLSPWTSLRARAFVFTNEGRALKCDDLKAWARGHMSALVEDRCVPPGRRLALVRLVRRTRKERAG